jgi:peptidoglycan/xylan/chitin deacetylase (PgdA/CDA1 family)
VAYPHDACTAAAPIVTRLESHSPEPAGPSPRSSGIVTLTFHGIGPTERVLTPGESSVWLAVEQFEEILDAARGRPDVHLTFDDGNVSDVQIALPRLLERGMRATFFLLAELVGRPGYVVRADVETVVREGMPIGLHGFSHRSWRSLDDRELDVELVEARATLEELARQPIVDVSCPFGDYDRRVLGRLRRESFDHVFTSDGGSARPDDWLQPRNSILATDDATCIDRIMASASSPIDRATRRGKRLIKQWR